MAAAHRAGSLLLEPVGWGMPHRCAGVCGLVGEVWSRNIVFTCEMGCRESEPLSSVAFEQVYEWGVVQSVGRMCTCMCEQAFLCIS